jgi:hypothetical protein
VANQRPYRSIDASSSANVLPYVQYAEKISVSENMLMHMPEGMSFERAAGFPEVSSFPLTLWGSSCKVGSKLTLRRHTSLPSKQFTSLVACNPVNQFLSTPALRESAKPPSKWPAAAAPVRSL